MLIPFADLLQRWSPEITGIIHCGGHLAEESDAYVSGGVSRVLWIEADPDTYDRLVERLRGVEGNMVANVCLADRDFREVTFHRANNGESSSILQFGTHAKEHPHVQYVDSLRMDAFTLDTVVAGMGVEGQFNFLNMDLQGAELLALRGATLTLKDMDYLYLEVNVKELYRNCALLPQLDEFLVGFKRVETELTPHGWGDAFWVREGLL